jgi:hypothetical protein
MKRMQKGSVRGISIKLQEEDRERRDNYVPDVSVIEVDNINVDVETKDMLRAMDMSNLKGISVTAVVNNNNRTETRPERDGGDRPRGERRERREPREPREPRAGALLLLQLLR